MRRTSTADAALLAARYHEIAALSLDEARQEATRLLGTPHCFECVEAVPSAADNLEALAPELRALFSKYERIVVVGMDATLDRGLIAPFGWDFDGPWREHQMWRIGTSHEHGLVLVKPHSEGVYDIDGMDPDDDLAEPTDASIYHWLIWVAQDGDLRK